MSVIKRLAKTWLPAPMMTIFAIEFLLLF